MKKTIFVLMVIAYLHDANAQTWKVDKSNTRLGFSAVHLLISEVHGSLNAFDVKLTSTKEDFTDAQIDLTAEVASISTSSEMRDNNLKSAYYFDAQKYPQLTFKSESLVKLAGNKYKLRGSLTIHGVSKQVIFDVIFNGMAVSPANQKPVAGFKITGTVSRTDFKIGEQSAGVSDEIKIDVDAEFFKMN